jgi:hypothetical protein
MGLSVMDVGRACCEVKFESCIPKCCEWQIYDKSTPWSLRRGVLHCVSRMVCSYCILASLNAIAPRKGLALLDIVTTHMRPFSAWPHCLVYILRPNQCYGAFKQWSLSQSKETHPRACSSVCLSSMGLSSNNEFAAKRF